MTTYFLIDGENIDATTWNLLGGKPALEFRPQWDRIAAFLAARFAAPPVKSLFFINFKGQAQFPFIQAIRLMGVTPILLSGPADQKIVDLAIIRTVDAIANTTAPDCPVVLGSHDGGDFAAGMQKLLDQKRPAAVLGFREYLSDRFNRLAPAGLQLLDLEYDAKAFKAPLPRILVVDIAEYDPAKYL
jgi:uncharacterized protein